jgi:hypothetical protein
VRASAPGMIIRPNMAVACQIGQLWAIPECPGADSELSCVIPVRNKRFHTGLTGVLASDIMVVGWKAEPMPQRWLFESGCQRFVCSGSEVDLLGLSISKRDK